MSESEHVVAGKTKGMYRSSAPKPSRLRWHSSQTGCTHLCRVAVHNFGPDLVPWGIPLLVRMGGTVTRPNRRCSVTLRASRTNHAATCFSTPFSSRVSSRNLWLTSSKHFGISVVPEINGRLHSMHFCPIRLMRRLTSMTCRPFLYANC